MSEDLLIGLASILALGTLAQWVAWKLRIPSILLLLVFGFIAGPVTGWLDPDDLLGDLLFPVVSLAVSVILFEGALGLTFREIREVATPVRRLISVGALITWVGSSVAAFYLLDLSAQIAALLGALVIVSGPTVVGPLLHHVRPVERPASVLKWEGILIDPIGVIVAVLVFEAVVAGEFTDPGLDSVVMFLETMLSGAAFGIVGALATIIPIRKYWIPDGLQNAVTLSIVVSVFAVANYTRHESGLLSVVIMGVIVANQPWVSIHHIIEFKENLRALLLGTLFVLLAARLTTDNLNQMLTVESFVFLGLLILVVRPLSVLASTLRSNLTWRERALVAWVMPRGIVAAAAASTFALGLAEQGIANADDLIPYTFMVIIGTVAIYGLTAAPVARLLGVARPKPEGVMIIGAHSWARSIASALHNAGVKVLVVDTNRSNIRQARMDELPAHYGSILAEHALEEIDLDGIGHVVALTRNSEVNALSLLRLSELFDRAELYQVPPPEGDIKERDEQVSTDLTGRFLVDSETSFRALQDLFQSGAEVKATGLTDEFTFADYQEEHSGNAIPLFNIDDGNRVTVFTADAAPDPGPGDTIISLITNGAVSQSPGSGNS